MGIRIHHLILPLQNIKFRVKILPELKRNYSNFNRNFRNNLPKRFLSRNLESNREIMKLSSVVKVIEKIVPVELSAKWDNTGLLIEPEVELPVSTVFLTNDLTEEVLSEAIAAKANLIVAYHPPIFNAMKVLLCQNWKDRIVMKCIANNIAVYAPHTACDAVQGGVNDWLIKCFDFAEVKPIQPAVEKISVVVEFIKPKQMDLNLVLGSCIEFRTLVSCDLGEETVWVKILIEADEVDLVLKKLNCTPEVHTIVVTQCRQPIVSSCTGMGRIGKLTLPLKLSACIKMMKEHAKVDNIRVSIGANNTLDKEISRIAACAGSGGSVLKDVSADLYITGEMSHHDILDCHHKRISIILCEHSNSERGYLSHLAGQLRSELLNVNVIVSSVDKDPISIH